jgi:hypothetical protein
MKRKEGFKDLRGSLWTLGPLQVPGLKEILACAIDGEVLGNFP